MSMGVEMVVDQYHRFGMSLSGFLMDFMVGVVFILCLCWGTLPYTQRTGQALWHDHCRPATADLKRSKNNNKVYII